ncbi:MAG: hypothetical protein IK061_05185 [Desulfovibrio sp.]|nr:hypothetical protein [Desulfovibrio sp.]
MYRDEPHGFLLTLNKMRCTSRTAVVFSEEGVEEFRVAVEQGVTFNAVETEMGGLKFKPSKVFHSSFDFSDGWVRQLAVEAVVLPAEKGRRYPPSRKECRQGACPVPGRGGRAWDEEGEEEGANPCLAQDIVCAGAAGAAGACLGHASALFFAKT